MKIERTNFKLAAEVEKLLPIRQESMYFASISTAALKENITWEQVTCVGYNPELRKLEAVVEIKQSYGYSGGLCTNGSAEYVRFFVDWGSGFENVGLTGFKAHDIPNPQANQQSINYMVYQIVDDATHRRLCSTAVMPKIRAILSWNSIPSLDPNQNVNFGNKIDANIQIKPKKWHLSDFLEVSKIKVTAEMSAMFQLSLPLEVKKLDLPIEELLEKNIKANVPNHRTLHGFMNHAMAMPTTKSMAKSNMFFDKIDLSKFGISWDQIYKGYDKEFNTTFEELTCVGLNSETDTLGAVIHVKKQNGYSGSLCYTGSTEYVAFWADWDDNGTFDYLGTSQVKVFDINNMPDNGLHYAVQLPVKPEKLRSCTKPNLVKIRAVMSWETPPSTTDPNAAVYWGNRKEVKVQLRPTDNTGNNIHFHYHDIGGVQEEMIDGGFAFPNAVQTAYSNRPFGGSVHIGGRFGAAGAHYKVEYSANGINWFPTKTGNQNFYVFNPVSGTYVLQSQTSPDGWYINVENLSGAIPIDEYSATLVDWDTSLLQGNFQIRVLYTLDTTHTSYATTAPKAITINNVRYNANSAFHNYMAGGLSLSGLHTVDMIFDNGGGCISQTQGTAFSGAFKSVHSYFSMAQLYVLPANSAAILSSGGETTPASGTLVRSIDASHLSGFGNEAWQLSTTNMVKCGYVLVLHAYERTIYNNDTSLPFDTVSIGFAVI
jgi:hypothetical protein